MAYRDAFTKIVNDVFNAMKEFGNDAGIYIGKTDREEERFKEHEEEKLFYCTVLAVGEPNLIARMEEELIVAFKNRSLNVLNKSEESLGNNEAKTLYVCVDSCHPKDELCEWTTLHLGEGYPIQING